MALRNRQLTGPAIAAELLRKVQYVHSRWVATLFYVDSTVDQTGAPLDDAIFQQRRMGFLTREGFVPAQF